MPHNKTGRKWLCETCGRRIQPNGVAAHRAAHIRREGGCVMTVRRGLRIYTYTYGEPKDA